MAVQRWWVTCTPAGRTLAQAAIDLAGLGDQVALESWVPYPAPENVKLYWIGWQGQETLWGQLLLALSGVVGLRHRRGPVRPTDSAMSAEQLMSQFPLPNSGPLATVVVTRKAALTAHYRDFALGPFDDDGSPGAAPASVVATETVKKK